MVKVSKPLNFFGVADLSTTPMASFRHELLLVMPDTEQLLPAVSKDCVVQGQRSVAPEAFEAGPVNVPKVRSVVELVHGERGRQVQDRLLAVEAMWFRRHFNIDFKLKFHKQPKNAIIVEVVNISAGSERKELYGST